MMKNLTALVLTYNEEDNIADCLDSINWIERVVVIDSYSDDRTEKICQQYDKVDFYENEFNDFASQRNFGLDKIETEWVFVIDADERVTEELRDEIKDVLNKPEVEGYEISRKNYFLGKWIKYCGWYPDYTLRLFRSKYKYKGLVHESPQINGRIDRLKNDFIHYTYKDLESYVSKMNQYTTLDAEKKYSAGKTVGISYILSRPFLEFVKKYILKRGFLLGSQGLILSILSAYYQFLKSVKLWELNKFGDGNL
ncbi:glycosyltransferase involved in cell wall biosynthesis [Halanaerobium saccharolyticum]|uniref:Glycosyltransferase involved in cell wall biosynthesis n=2 Tax=Halanaerobium saccharolyticum TaxID=43595 RepID=A0A4R6M2Z1_9FIRM|nr:glycosyltransferase family 2 protein [Halanaerobium saccharolyticum]TDO94800.1 glycosyltransferase involved in cell wall biosynthesis [Halanaerobium saccharolyticum]